MLQRLNCMAIGPGRTRCPQEAEETSNYCPGHNWLFAAIAEERIKGRAARRRALWRTWVLSLAAIIGGALFVLGSS